MKGVWQLQWQTAPPDTSWWLQWHGVLPLQRVQPSSKATIGLIFWGGGRWGWGFDADPARSGV
jgi:hypothetical protein